MKKTEQISQCYEILNNYNGKNTYMLMLKKDVFINKKRDVLSDFNIEYILTNKDIQPKEINKNVRIAEWYGENRRETWNIDFTPKILKIVTYLGETTTTYNCYVKYRQSVDPVMCFIPKKALLNNFLCEDYENKEIDFQRYDNLSTSVDPNRKLKEHQKTAVKFLTTRKKCILADEMGGGKMEPNTSLIPTEKGFKKMGEISVGDVIFSSNGKRTTVLKTFPHKNKEIYRVYFNDCTYADCGLEHLWPVRICGNFETKSLGELFELGLKSGNMEDENTSMFPSFEIPMAKPVTYDNLNVFSPYLLGYFIGKGKIKGNNVVLYFNNSRIECIEKIKQTLKENYILKQVNYNTNKEFLILNNSSKDENNVYLDTLNGFYDNNNRKRRYIPEIYKTSSIEERIELLKGLMDANGTITPKHKKVIFSCHSQRLMEDFSELVYSLGGATKCVKYKSKTSNLFKIEIFLNFNPFTITKKKDKFIPSDFKKKIISAEFVRNEDATCLMVDSEDHTYLTSRNYIVTHNTTSLIVSAIEGNFDSVLIICPASIKTNWKNELLYYVPEKDITIIESFANKTKSELEEFLGYAEGKSNMKREELIDEAKINGKWKFNKFVIVNFDILDEFFTFSRATSEEAFKKNLEKSPILKYIYNRKSCLIIDEAHKLSNNTSIRYKVIKQLIKKGEPESIYLATGTPITNNPQNLFYILNLIENEITSDYRYYQERYCGAKQIPMKGEYDKWKNIWLKQHGFQLNKYLSSEQWREMKDFIDKKARKIFIAQDATNLDELKEKVSHIYLRREKEDFGNIPKKIVHEIYYDLNQTQQNEYDRLWEAYIKEKEKQDTNTEDLNKQLLEGGIYRKYLSNQMVHNTITLCDNILKTQNKVVIMCCYDEELYSLKEYYGEHAVIYNGKCNQKQKDKAIEDFKNDNNVKVFIGNIIAAGVGINLTVAKSLIFNTFSYVTGENRQAEDRIHRLTTTSDVDVYYQIFKNTHYQHMWDIVLKKQLISDTVIKKESEK